MKLNALLSIAALLASGMTAQAALLFYESFDYNTGDLSTESSNTWSDSGTTVESGSLSYGSLTTNGNRVTMSDDSSWIGTGGAFDGFMDDGDTLWFSVLVNTRSSTNPDFGFAIGTDRLTDSNSVPMANPGDGLGFRVKSGIRATAWSGTPSSSGASAYSEGTTILVVGEIIFGATDTINLYLPDTDLNQGSVVQTQTGTFTQSGFDTISFSDKAASPRDQVDEIRFGTSYADVTPVPEPSVAWLGGLGAMLFLRRRR